MTRPEMVIVNEHVTIGLVYAPRRPMDAAYLVFSDISGSSVTIDFTGPDSMRRLRALAADILHLTAPPATAPHLKAVPNHA